MSTNENTELTKECIMEALFLLMEQMPYASISITDITERAGVGRATYYRHFKSKDDILREYFRRETRNFMKSLPMEIRCKDDYYEIIFTVFSRLKDLKTVVQKLIAAHLEFLYLDYLNASMAENLLHNYANFSNKYDSYYFAGALYNVSIQWVKNDCAESVKQLTDQYFNAMFLSSFLQ